jgi:hypothetical protein
LLEGGGTLTHQAFQACSPSPTRRRWREFGQMGIASGRVKGKANLKVLFGFAGSAVSGESTVNEPRPPKI